MTAVLIIAGAVVIGVAEYGVADRPHDTPAVLASLFHSITSRTAGFNITPTEALTPASVAMLVVLMFIGGCPGGTAGGIKATALYVALLDVKRMLLGRTDMEIFGRRLSDDTGARAHAAITLALAWAAVAVTVLAITEPHVVLADLVFEVISALSTVGLTRGVTPSLSDAGKLVIIVTMFVGRIGVFYFAFALFGRLHAAAYRLPEDNVYVT